MSQQSLKDWVVSFCRMCLSIGLIWLMACLLISFFKGILPGACNTRWGIERVVVGDLFCSVGSR